MTNYEEKLKQMMIKGEVSSNIGYDDGNKFFIYSYSAGKFFQITERGAIEVTELNLGRIIGNKQNKTQNIIEKKNNFNKLLSDIDNQNMENYMVSSIPIMKYVYKGEIRKALC